MSIKCQIQSPWRKITKTLILTGIQIIGLNPKGCVMNSKRGTQMVATFKLLMMHYVNVI